MGKRQREESPGDNTTDFHQVEIELGPQEDALKTTVGAESSAVDLWVAARDEYQHRRRQHESAWTRADESTNTDRADDNQDGADGADTERLWVELYERALRAFLVQLAVHDQVNWLDPLPAEIVAQSPSKPLLNYLTCQMEFGVRMRLSPAIEAAHCSIRAALNEREWGDHDSSMRQQFVKTYIDITVRLSLLERLGFAPDDDNVAVDGAGEPQRFGKAVAEVKELEYLFAMVDGVAADVKASRDILDYALNIMATTYWDPSNTGGITNACDVMLLPQSLLHIMERVEREWLNAASMHNCSSLGYFFFAKTVCLHQILEMETDADDRAAGVASVQENMDLALAAYEAVEQQPHTSIKDKVHSLECRGHLLLIRVGLGETDDDTLNAFFQSTNLFKRALELCRGNGEMAKFEKRLAAQVSELTFGE